MYLTAWFYKKSGERTPGALKLAFSTT